MTQKLDELIAKAIEEVTVHKIAQNLGFTAENAPGWARQLVTYSLETVSIGNRIFSSPRKIVPAQVGHLTDIGIGTETAEAIIQELLLELEPA